MVSDDARTAKGPASPPFPDVRSRLRSLVPHFSSTLLAVLAQIVETG